MKVSVLGLGKLGAPLAAVLAERGHSVVGVDVDPKVVAAISNGQAPVNEPGLQDLISKNKERLRATLDLEAAIHESELTFIVTPTPSGNDGIFSLKYVLPSVTAIGQALCTKKSYHLVVLTSTVMPGDTFDSILPALEKSSQKQVGRDFGLCYNPEFIALGSVCRDLMEPDFVLIGESDSNAGSKLAEFYKTICIKQPKIVRTNFVNAELAKLSVNTFVTTKISYANMLAEICEKLPGADVDVVTSAIGLDSRIGAKYLKGALGYGGPCFPRDNIAFSAIARRQGVRALLAEATDATNREQIFRLLKIVLERHKSGSTVGILGLSYKPDTDVIDESQGVELARQLTARAIDTIVYDPAALHNSKRALEDSVQYANSAEECIVRCDIVVVATAWPAFQHIPLASLTAGNKRRTIIDCWRIFAQTEVKEMADYVLLGRGRLQ